MIKGSGDYNDSSTTSHHPVKFGGHRHCSGRDIMDLVCHMIYQDHVTKGLSS